MLELAALLLGVCALFCLYGIADNLHRIANVLEKK